MIGSRHAEKLRKRRVYFMKIVMSSFAGGWKLVPPHKCRENKASRKWLRIYYITFYVFVYFCVLQKLYSERKGLIFLSLSRSGQWTGHRVVPWSTDGLAGMTTVI